jgi:oligoribonuclease (3'-5' exoribonuclease)
MKNTLAVGNVAQEDRVPFVTYLLRGESTVWWKTRQALLAPGVVVTWEQFQEFFRTHHIPESLMDRKREEFCNLEQGNNDVLTYSREFTQLSRYAGDEISSDASLQRRFLKGLNPTLKFQISLFSCKNFEELVNLALKAESVSQEFEKSQKHSRDSGSSSSVVSRKKYRVWVQDPVPLRSSSLSLLSVRVCFPPSHPSSCSKWCSSSEKLAKVSWSSSFFGHLFHV